MAKNIKAQQAERFRTLAEIYGLTGEDFFKAPQGFIIITRNGIEKIQRGLEATVHYDVIPEFSIPESGMYVIKATGLVEMSIASERTGKLEKVDKIISTFGEASPKNCRNAYPVAMAEKRALSRCILKLADFYELGVKGEDEIDDKQNG